MKKIIKFIYTIIIASLILIAGFVFLSTFNTPIKIRLFSVQSGSMEPAIPVGGLVVVRPADEYKVGDIITFKGERNPKETATHRVVEVIKDEEIGKTSYKTKGDANENADSEAIASSRVVGKVISTIPLLGYILSFAQTQTGLIVLVVIPATLIIYSEIQSVRGEIVKMVGKRKTNEETEEESPQEEEKEKVKNGKKKSKNKST